MFKVGKNRVVEPLDHFEKHTYQGELKGDAISICVFHSSPKSNFQNYMNSYIIKLRIVLSIYLLLIFKSSFYI